ncbi:MAG: PEGA domain-containing protein [Planctomycetota bacterium]
MIEDDLYCFSLGRMRSFQGRKCILTYSGIIGGVKLVKLWRKYGHLWAALAGIAMIAGGTFLAIRWAKGDRPRFGNKGPAVTGTGLLVASSDPKGAQVFINGKLTSATDDTLNLTPGEYLVEIKKDGFISWKKNLQIKAELVVQTDARLFPSVPNLTPLTFTGIKEPVSSSDGQKIVYKVDSASTEVKNGLWVLELTDHNLPIARTSEPRQIARNTSQYNFMDANLLWSTDNSQVLAYWTEENIKYKSQNLKYKNGKQQPTAQTTEKEIVIKQAILLDASRMNDVNNLTDATTRLPVTLAQWYQDLDLKEQKRLAELPEFMQKLVNESATGVYFSPDERRVMYTASKEMVIPDELITDLPSESTQNEQRSLAAGKIYVYDIKEDRNYLMEGAALSVEEQTSNTESIEKDNYWVERFNGNASMSAETSKPNVSLPPIPNTLVVPMLDKLKIRYSPIFTQTAQWFPTSAHLITTYTDKIVVTEYDGQNSATVYAGPFNSSFVYPWPNGNRLVIMTNFSNSTAADNLYALNLK